MGSQSTDFKAKSDYQNQRDKYNYRQNHYTVKNKDELKEDLESFFEKKEEIKKPQKPIVNKVDKPPPKPVLDEFFEEKPP